LSGVNFKVDISDLSKLITVAGTGQPIENLYDKKQLEGEVKAYIDAEDDQQLAVISHQGE